MHTTTIALFPFAFYPHSLKSPSPTLNIKPFQLIPNISSSTCHKPLLHSSSSSRLRFSVKISSPFLVSSIGNRSDFQVRAADRNVQTSGFFQAFQLGTMFGIWYILNIAFNIYNKQVLKVYPYPATVTAFEFGFGTLIIILMWTFNLYTRPKITRSQFAAILPLAVAHMVGHVLTNTSLGKVSVSFTHTIKAMEPFFTVVLSALFLGARPSLWVISSLVPIVGGVALASLTEVSFNWIGFCSAMASNLTNQSRNVFSKKFMVKEEETLDNVNLFSVITIISFVLLVPVAIVVEGIKFTPSYLQIVASQGLKVGEFSLRLLLAAFCFHAYQQVSYSILHLVSPVTHAVGNCVKRMAVIVSSVIFFQTPVSPINSLGTAVALAGVFLYSRAKQMEAKPKST